MVISYLTSHDYAEYQFLLKVILYIMVMKRVIEVIMNVIASEDLSNDNCRSKRRTFRSSSDGISLISFAIFINCLTNRYYN